MDRFYQDLSRAVEQVPVGDVLLIMGDLSISSSVAAVVGPYT